MTTVLLVIDAVTAALFAALLLANLRMNRQMRTLGASAPVDSVEPEAPASVQPAEPQPAVGGIADYFPQGRAPDWLNDLKGVR